MFRVLPSVVIGLALLATTSRAGVVEVPLNGATYSGVLYVSGWKCPPNSNITISFDAGAPIPAASRIPRGDTASSCRNDGRNGYILQWNYNLLGDGAHTVSVWQGGVEFASSTFNVTTFGSRFLRGAQGMYELPNFPVPGASATLEWDEAGESRAAYYCAKLGITLK